MWKPDRRPALWAANRMLGFALRHPMMRCLSPVADKSQKRLPGNASHGTGIGNGEVITENHRAGEIDCVGRGAIPAKRPWPGYRPGLCVVLALLICAVWVVRNLGIYCSDSGLKAWGSHPRLHQTWCSPPPKLTGMR